MDSENQRPFKIQDRSWIHFMHPVAKFFPMAHHRPKRVCRPDAEERKKILPMKNPPGIFVIEWSPCETIGAEGDMWGALHQD